MHASAYLSFTALTLLACSQQPTETSKPDRPASAQVLAHALFPETFEAGTKGAYEEADEDLGTGTWHFQDALIGSSPQDHKSGQHAARLRNRPHPCQRQ